MSDDAPRENGAGMPDDRDIPDLEVVTDPSRSDPEGPGEPMDGAAPGGPLPGSADQALGEQPAADETFSEHPASAEVPPGGHDDAHVDAGPSIEQLAADDPRTREELLAAVLATEAQRDEFLDDLRRARAEFENFRRRSARESATQRDAGKAEAVRPLLEVLDDLDRTLDAAAGSDDPDLAKGVSLVAEKLARSLQGLGLERLDTTGVAFDPTEHEAVSQRAAEGESDQPTVAEVFRPGYRLGERVLRPAMVVVEQ